MTASFRAENKYNGSLDRVVSVLSDPAFYASMAGKSWLEPDRLVSAERTGDQFRLQVHYAFKGELNSKAKRFVEPDKLTWVETKTFDLATGKVTGDVDPDEPKYKKMLSPSMTGTIAESAGTTTFRCEVSVKVHGIPLVGGKAEKWLAGIFERHLVRETEAINEVLGSG